MASIDKDSGPGKQRDPAEGIRTSLAAIDAFEPAVGAFVAYDAAPDAARAASGPLSGLTLGVKDIIETRDFGTEYGSPIYAGHRSRGDAACVALLQAAGAVVVGKTVTTEFAFFRPGKTRNPHNLAHTPGGSSSGSAAAVACGMVDIALGSQTAASLTRPASYCGVVGFKPTYGGYNLAGVKAFAPSFDTLGVLGARVDTVAAAHAVLSGPIPSAATFSPKKPRKIGICRTPWWGSGSADMQHAFEAAVARLGAATTVESVALDDFADTAELHRTIMSYEAAQSLAWEYAQHRDSLSAHIVDLIEAGRRVDRATYTEALAAAADARRRIGIVLDRYDALLAPAAPGEAPHGIAATGDPIFSRMWTLLHLPTVTLPGMLGAQGLPIGVQLLAHAGSDQSLLEYALWAEQQLPHRPIPDLAQSAL